MEDLKSNQSKSRLEYMDFAKGIAILAVIAGHVYYPPEITGKVIYSFHMPLFFLINGYFIKSYDIKRCLNRSVKQLLLPYAIATCVEIIAEIWLAGGIKGFKMATVLLLDMIGGMCKPSPMFPCFNGTWILWFLPCLFLTRNIFVIVMHLTEKVNYQWAVRLLAFVVLSFSGMMLALNGYFPWCLEIALVILPILYCGNMFHKHELFFDKRRFLMAGIGAVIWILFICLDFYVELATHYWPGLFLPLVEGMIASFVVICISQMADKVPGINSIFRWLGKNSLIILIVHNTEFRYIRWEAILNFEMADKRLVVLIVRICFILLVTGIVSLISYIWKTKIRSAVNAGNLQGKAEQ